MAARTTAVVSFAICFIFGVGCSWRGAVANGASWGGCVDNGSSCGVVFKLSNRFFGALAGARFFFGFRPRLLGIGSSAFKSSRDCCEYLETRSLNKPLRAKLPSSEIAMRAHAMQSLANGIRRPWTGCPSLAIQAGASVVVRAELMSTLDAELNDFGAQLAMIRGHAADRDG